MTHTKTLLCCLPLALLLGKTTSAQDTKHTLRMSFQKGTTSYQETTSRMNMKMEFAGTPMNMSMDMSMVAKNHVKEFKDGVATLEQTVMRVKLAMNQPMMGKVEYDSAVEGSDPGPMGDIAKLVGVLVTIQVNDRGKVLDTKFPQEFLDGLSGVMTEKDMQGMFGRDIAALPESPVAIGEEWESKSDLPMGQMGEIAMKAKNKLVKFENGVATIEQKFEIDSPEIASPMGGKMKIQGKSTSGQVVLALGKGEILSSTQEMEMALDGGEQMKMNMVSVTEVTPIPADKVAEKTGKK